MFEPLLWKKFYNPSTLLPSQPKAPVAETCNGGFLSSITAGTSKRQRFILRRQTWGPKRADG